MGEYVLALQSYIDQETRFPNGDTTIRFHADDLYFAVRGALRFWKDLPDRNGRNYFEVLRNGRVFMRMGRSSGVFPLILWRNVPRNDLESNDSQDSAGVERSKNSYVRLAVSSRHFICTVVEYTVAPTSTHHPTIYL